MTRAAMKKQLLERGIERYLVKRVKERGGEVRKVKWIGRRHAPDRVVMAPAWSLDRWPRVCVWVELKKPGEKLRPDCMNRASTPGCTPARIESMRPT